MVLGSGIQGSKRHRIPDPDPQHWILFGFCVQFPDGEHWSEPGLHLPVPHRAAGQLTWGVATACSSWGNFLNIFTAFYQCWESVTFWCRSRSADPYLWLTHPDLDPTPDPTPFFSDLIRMEKNHFFIITYRYRYPQAHYLQSLIYCFKDKFCVNFILQALFQSAQHLLWEKGRIRIRTSD